MFSSSAYRTKRWPRRDSSWSSSSSTILLSNGLRTPRTQKVTSVVSRTIGVPRLWTGAPVRRSRWHGNAVAEHDRIIADEYLLDHQAHQALPLDDVDRVRRL